MMTGVRLLLLSDTHANFAALEAVLAHAARHRYDKLVHLGDAVGYGPHAREVVQKLRELEATCIEGNHEHMLLQYADGSEPRKESVVGAALQYQLTQLGPQDIAWIRSWPDGIEDQEIAARYRHGTPTSLDDYMDSVTAAREAFGQWQGKVGFVGHTHTPAVYATLNAPVGEWIKTQTFTDGGSYMIPPAARVILNPGSVGQPRDGNPQASYAVYDSARHNFEVFRVDYDIEATQQAIRAAGLPEVLAARLAIGK